MQKLVRFACGNTPLETVLAAIGEKGLVAVLMGDDRARLHQELARVVPEAELVEDPQALEETLTKVMAAINAPGTKCDVPLDMQGSAVEMAVWQALRRIPVGETRSYGQIAKTLPVTATAQEVGAACAANVLAGVVPCHRVVKADGSISGYRWGVSRKRRLLAMERAA